MVNHHAAKFDGNRRCGSGDMFLEVEKHDFTCLLNLLFFLKHKHVMITHTKFHNKNSLDENIYQCAQWEQSDESSHG